MFALSSQVVPLRGPGSKGYLSVGQDSSIGQASLAAVYSYTLERQQTSEASLDSPFRELWAGRSVVIRQSSFYATPRGDAVLNIQLRLTRR